MGARGMKCQALKYLKKRGVIGRGKTPWTGDRMRACMNCRRWFGCACRKEKHQYIQNMKHLNHSSRPGTLTAMVGGFAAALALLGTVTPTLADDSERQNSEVRYGDERRDNQITCF